MTDYHLILGSKWSTIIISIFEVQIRGKILISPSMFLFHPLQAKIRFIYVILNINDIKNNYHNLKIWDT
jgi:hypothetical protein